MLSNSSGVPLLELQEDSNLARRLKIKCSIRENMGTPIIEGQMLHYGRSKVKGGSLGIRDPFVAVVAFALRVEEGGEFPYASRCLDHVCRFPDCTHEAGISPGAH